MSLFTFKALYKAYKECVRTKRGTLNAQRFERDLITHLIDLETSLQNRTYRPGRSLCFAAYSPKMREIFAADFKDRVTHHLLVRALEPLYERKFIYDVYNNRKGKGIHAAAKRAQKFARKYPFFLQLDIKGFFYSLDKHILFKRLYADITKSTLPDKQEILYLANRIIYHDPTHDVGIKGRREAILTLPPHKSLFHLPKHIGLPIGNLTSQFFANVYMNPFDHFIKRILKVKGYLRYVDDFVLFADSRAELEKYKNDIKAYLKNQLGLSLRDEGVLRSVEEGMDFLGYIVRPHYMLVRRRVVHNYKYKKAQYLTRYEEQKGKMNLAEIKAFLSVQASFLAHAKHANSFNLIQQVGVLNESDPFSFDRV